MPKYIDNADKLLEGICNDIVRLRKQFDEGYQGWTNRETWCVTLWLNNTEGVIDHCREQLAPLTNEPRFKQTDALYAFVRDWTSESVQPSLASDLVTSALYRVDWDEVLDGVLPEAD